MTTFKSTRLTLPTLARVLCGGLVACNPTFDPASEIQSLRILAVQADPPYATPGAPVTLDVLAFDGRPAQPEPMAVSWVSTPCENPAGDDYYKCFPAFARQFTAGTDLTALLSPGTRFSVAMPADVISSHVNTRGGDAYGILFVFAFACAGHVEYLPIPAGAGPNTVPFGCFDSTGNTVGPDGFVFAYATVYAFANRTNTNPVIDHLTFNGSAIVADAGIAVASCTVGTVTDCPTSEVATIVPPSSQEADPGDLDPSGNALKEEIWVDYYVTGTEMKHDTIILYDPRVGALGKTADDLYAPRLAGLNQLWAVVHDNRGGVAWTEVPLQSH